MVRLGVELLMHPYVGTAASNVWGLFSVKPSFWGVPFFGRGFWLLNWSNLIMPFHHGQMSLDSSK